MKSIGSRLRKLLKPYIGSSGNPLLPARTMEHLAQIRMQELHVILKYLPASARVLEIGAGTGWQAQRLFEAGFKVEAIDVPVSNYAGDRIWPVRDYDGHAIPFEDQSFDCVFSSNTLEHIPHVRDFQSEIQRVLRPDGVAVHLLPSAPWRIWTNLTNPIRYFTPPLAHGEHAGNAFSEIWYFRRAWWKRLFAETGWRVDSISGNGLFYTGCSIADRHLTIPARMRLSRLLGSSCNVYVLSHGTVAAVSA